MTVSGNSKLLLDGCVIKGEIGIYIHGKARVKANNCWIEGTNRGVFMIGSGDLEVTGGVLKGPGGTRFTGYGAAVLLGSTKLTVRDTKVWGFVRTMGNGSVFGLDR